MLAKDVHPSTEYVLGVALSFFGGYLFTMAKYRQVAAAAVHSCALGLYACVRPLMCDQYEAFCSTMREDD